MSISNFTAKIIFTAKHKKHAVI